MSLSVCIYCASSNSLPSVYYQEAAKVAKVLIAADVHVKFGGGNSGLMGKIADTYIEQKIDNITGIIPAFMHEEGWHHGRLKHLIITESMHERKQKMIEDVDAAIALPGGVGTLEEVLEVITWKQLGIFLKPIILVNTNGYFDKFVALLEHATSENFMRKEHLQLFTVVNHVDNILEAITSSTVYDVSIRKIAQI